MIVNRPERPHFGTTERGSDLSTQEDRTKRLEPRAWGVRGAFAIGAAAALALALGACNKDERAAAGVKPEPPTFELEVTTPVRAMLPRTVRVTGTLYGEEEATIASKVSGRVVEVLADLGDRMEPGAALVRIDPTDYELLRDERSRAMVEMLAQIGLTELPARGGGWSEGGGEGGDEIDIDSVPLVARAILEAENARVRFERARQLAESEPPLMGPQEFSDIRTAFEVAKSNVEVQRLEARSILARARTLEVQVRIAAQRIEDSTPRAPEATVSGNGSGTASYEIAQRSVSVGDFVQIGDPLMRLVDSDPIKLRVSVPERRFAEIKVGQPTSVVADAATHASATGHGAKAGRVSRVAPSLDASTRTLPIEVLIPNPDGALKPGGFATAEITVGEQEALVVPASAIVTFAGVHKVIVVADGSAQEKRVMLGARAKVDDGTGIAEKVEILSGLEGGETIALAPPSSVTTGARVRVVERAARTP